MCEYLGYIWYLKLSKFIPNSLWKWKFESKVLRPFPSPIPANTYPLSILHKSIVGRYRPVRVADGPITARCRFIKNAGWDWTQSGSAWCLYTHGKKPVFPKHGFIIMRLKHLNTSERQWLITVIKHLTYLVTGSHFLIISHRLSNGKGVFRHMGQRRLLSACASAQTDQGLCWPLYTIWKTENNIGEHSRPFPYWDWSGSSFIPKLA